MIQTSWETYCENCPEMDPTASILYANDKVELIIITCRHRERCDRIYRRMLQEQKQKERSADNGSF